MRLINCILTIVRYDNVRSLQSVAVNILRDNRDIRVVVAMYTATCKDSLTFPSMSNVFSYSFGFEPNSNWTKEYPEQHEIHEYFVGVAQKYCLYQHIRFNTTVKSAKWDDLESVWQVRVVVNAGTKESEYSKEYNIICDFLFSGVGQLNVPNYTNLKNRESFKRKIMHSARWDTGFDYSQLRIAVIGFRSYCGTDNSGDTQNRCPCGRVPGNKSCCTTRKLILNRERLIGYSHEMTNLSLKSGVPCIAMFLGLASLIEIIS